MARYKVITLVLAACLLSQQIHGLFVIEQGGLKIKYPSAARLAHLKGFDMSLANFGAPKYGGELTGKLIYVDSSAGMQNICSPAPCKYACQSFKDAIPSVDLRQSVRDDDNNPEDFIIMVDRGPDHNWPDYKAGQAACKFAEKVWHAQEAGAIGVVVVNYEDKHTTMEAPDENDEQSFKYLRNITIPAGFIKRTDGEVLKDLMRKSALSPNPVYMTMDWKDILPRHEKVNWEFWTNSNDMCGPVCDVQKEFIKEFVPVARELESKNWTSFTPHYIIWVCPKVYRQSEECTSQCIHKGRYCTPDPDGDLDKGYSGVDIMQENLRQLCVFKLASAKAQPWLWWEYVTRFGEQCQMDDKNYNDACATEVFKQINGLVWSTLKEWRDCVGTVDADTKNDLLEQEMASMKGDQNVGEVFILPTIRINDAQYRGKMAYSEVLSALCSGFSKGAEPEPCLDVAEDRCREGSIGWSTCHAKKDGNTKCQNKFSEFVCTCGDGFVAELDAITGKTTGACVKPSTMPDAAAAAAAAAADAATPAWAVFLIVVSVVGTVAGAGYAVYRYRIRQAMHQEIRAIMAQYMPLGEESEREGLQLANGAPDGHV